MSLKLNLLSLLSNAITFTMLSEVKTDCHVSVTSININLDHNKKQVLKGGLQGQIFIF